MKTGRPQSNLGFRIMSLMLRVRDRFRPPADVLLEAGVRPGMTVVDFGCGPGSFTLAASPLVGPEGLVYAVDIHPLALSMVRRAVQRRGCANVRTVPGGDPEGVPKACADMVLLYDVLHGLPDSGRALAALHRLLKPGGVLSVNDHHMKEDSLIATVAGTGLYAPAGRVRRTFRFDRIGMVGGLE